MSELRKLQKVGYSTLTVSIPSRFVKSSNLKPGDVVFIEEEADGTLRLIPKPNPERNSRARISLDPTKIMLVERILEGCYALGFDKVEITSKDPVDKYFIEKCKDTIRRLKGLEIVETGPGQIIIQSFIDPTRFPVDGLMKRLQLIVSQSFENIMLALSHLKTSTARLNEVRRNSNEIKELYWLIVRQLLVALNRRELSKEIGIESPLHASGDRVVAKALVEIGSILERIGEEILIVKGKKVSISDNLKTKILELAKNVESIFVKTVESFLTPDLKLIKEATEDMENIVKKGNDFLRSNDDDFLDFKVMVLHLLYVVDYCSVINEISIHRFLRKSKPG